MPHAATSARKPTQKTPRLRPCVHPRDTGAAWQGAPAQESLASFSTGATDASSAPPESEPMPAKVWARQADWSTATRSTGARPRMVQNYHEKLLAEALELVVRLDALE